MGIDDRKKKILKAVVENYIENAEPVGSRALSGQCGLELSAATIRNEMSELEDMGYLEKPHTSAGRVPSPLGYRLYVNELMRSHELTASEISSINNSLAIRMRELSRMMSDAGRLISDLTKYTAYVMTPVMDQARIRHFSLVGVSDLAFLIIAVTEANVVRNKLHHMPYAASAEAFRLAEAALNVHLTMLRADEYTAELIHHCEAAAGEGRFAVLPAASFACEVMRELARQDVFVEGDSHLLRHPEYKNAEKAQNLMEYLHSTREDFGRGVSDGVGVLIGPENVAQALEDASVVVTTCNIGEGMRGLIGVVGPTRMDYSKIISRLSYFTRGLERLLRTAFLEDGSLGDIDEW